LDYLNSQKVGAGKNQIIEKVDELEAQLSAFDQKLDDYLAKNRVTQSELEYQFAWQIAWEKYTREKLTDQALEVHFNRNKRRFDGTKLRIAHLLLKQKQNSGADRKSEAERIHTELQKGTINWNDAVKQFSEAPTAKTRGEIGWIKQSGPMPKSFTQSAFKLNLNEISPPVKTTFGYHIIKCTEIKTGKQGWKDNYESVKADATRFLFDVIVKAHRPKTTIKYEAD
jgi:parvulin-like peptidyl-prolyl isomerase